ncbi:MAG TPA: phosphoketolase family protein [Mycobacteriales bacterium]|nr:phosphoketolase family protein [Mycobacteriales bacterium]
MTTGISAAPATARPAPDDEQLRLLDAWWRAANYLSVGQIYLLDNPLLREPLQLEHVKPRLLGHWGTTPGLTFLWAHLNRAIVERDTSMLYVTGPGHGGPGVVATAYLEGTYSELYSSVTTDLAGMRQLFRQFSFPGGIPSHAAPETPGSIHEGGELGYSLMHAYGAAFDNPDLIVACVIGDGEAETGPLATSWHSNKFLDPVADGAVLPILHLNGFKIANPTVLARIPEPELLDLMRGYGYQPFVVEGGFDGEDPMAVHRRMASTLDEILDRIASIQQDARSGKDRGRPLWPMLVLRTPKGWTGPREVDGIQVEGSYRSHQVPLAELKTRPDHLAQLEEWLRSYRPEELFDDAGTLRPELAALTPAGPRRMSDTPHANGGLLLKDLRLPDFRDYAVDVSAPARGLAEATKVLGTWLRDVIRLNPETFRIMGPDETASNRLGPVFEVTDRVWEAEIDPAIDDHLAPSGRVMEVLSEHLCQGWLEGYLLTGRHGLFNCYEAFIHIVDAMFNQHAKWLESTRDIPWRRPIASLNYLLSSHVWRQDHNGFSHQDPGFIDLVVNKKADVVRVYLPPDANTLLSTYDHCLRSRNYVNVVVAGKQPALTYLSMDEAIAHCTRGAGIWEWASNDDGAEPDVVLGCAGDIPTLETLAAVDLLRKHLPELKVRVVNVVDLMRLQDEKEHPHGMSGREFDTLFTTDRPIIFAFHGYPTLIHRLTYRRTNHGNLHVRGFKEEGTTTTPFDMVMLNDLDRFRLVMDVIDRVPGLGARHAALRQRMSDARLQARAYTREHGEDVPEISRWAWPYEPDGSRRDDVRAGAGPDTGDDNVTGGTQSAGGEDAMAASG